MSSERWIAIGQLSYITKVQDLYIKLATAVQEFAMWFVKNKTENYQASLY